MKNLQQGLMEKSRLAKHAYEEGHRIQWKEAKAVQIEINKICRKYKEAAQQLGFPSLFYLKTEEDPASETL
jgi:hypothetical protein